MGIHPLRVHHAGEAVLRALDEALQAHRDDPRLEAYGTVDELWKELKAASPEPSLMAEGRIVAAGALADQGDLRGALSLMSKAREVPKKVRDHHLRQWYVIADLLDWFEAAAFPAASA